LKIIGLTGPSGSGKGAVAEILRREGFFTLDADQIYKELVLPKPSYQKELVALFSPVILNDRGEVDRKTLGKVVFSDVKKRELLNKAAHKRVEEEIFAILGQKSDLSAVVIDAPQLFESGLDKHCDFIISVAAPEALRMERIIKRDHITKEDALLRFSSQFGDDYFLVNSDVVIVNDGDEQSLTLKVLEAIRKFRKTTEGK